MEVKKGYKQTDIGIIPDEWDAVKMGDAGHSFIGLTYSPANVRDYGTLVLRSSNVQNGQLAYYDNVYVDMPLPKRVIVEIGDILICVRNGSRQLIGKCALIDDKAAGVAFGAFMTIYRSPYNSIIFYQFQAGVIQRQINETLGATINQITNRDLARFIVPLPKKPTEQTAIATALSDTDALIRSLEKLIDKKRAIKQGAMQELLTGKRRLPGFEGNGGFQKTEVGKVPADWAVVRMGDVGQTFIGLTYSPSCVAEHGVLVLRSSNVQNGKLSYEDNVFVQMDLPPRVMVQEGDILICVRNGSRQLIGKCALIDKSADGAAFGAFMSLYRSKHSPFIFRQFQSAIIQRQINETLGATINQITNKDMARFLVCLPKNPDEENAIVEVLSDMDSELSALESKLAKYRTIKQGMMQELLTGKTRLI